MPSRKKNRACRAVTVYATTLAASLPGFEVEQLYALLAPAGTPRDVVRRLNSDTAKAMQGADIKRQLLSDGSEVVVSTPEALEKRIVAEIGKWSKVIKAAGIRQSSHAGGDYAARLKFRAGYVQNVRHTAIYAARHGTIPGAA